LKFDIESNLVFLKVCTGGGFPEQLSQGREYSALDFGLGLDIALFFRLRHHFPRNLPQVPFSGLSDPLPEVTHLQLRDKPSRLFRASMGNRWGKTPKGTVYGKEK